MGFFILDQNDVTAYIDRFMKWLEIEKGGEPKKRPSPGGSKVPVIARVNPITRAGYQIGWAWVESTGDGHAVRGRFQHFHDWEVLEVFPPMLSSMLQDQLEKEAREKRANTNDPMPEDLHAHFSFYVQG